MRKFFLLTALCICALMVNAQVPQSFSFQAVVRDLDNELVTNKRIKLTLSILQGTTPETASVVYSETHDAETNLNGLFTVMVGQGRSGGSFSSINWKDGNFYLKCESTYGTSVTQLLSVPFAMYAEKAGSVDIDLSDYALKTDIPTDTVADYVSRNESKWIAQSYPDLSIYALKTDIPTDTIAEYVSSNRKEISWLGNNIFWLGNRLDSLVKKEATKDKLSLLTDVALTSAEAGQVLSFDGSKWVNKTVEAKTALSELTDVTISKNLADGHILKYDGESKKWINAPEGDMWKIWEKGIYTTQRVEIGKSTSTTPFTDDSKFLLEISQSDGHGILFKENEMYMKGGSIVVGSTSKVEKIINSTPNVPVGCLAFYGDIDSDHNFAFGINGDKSVVSGSKGSIAFGTKCNVLSSNNAAGFGSNIKVQKADCQFVCGRFNVAVPKEDGNNVYPLFIVGNGTADNARSNAFWVTSEGKVFANSVELSSDSRLKTNVNGISSALDKVVKLRGVTFNWDSSKKPSADKKLQYGFIAQEVEKIFPELVTTDSEGFKSLNYIGIVPVLTEAVKELKAENDELKSTIQDLVKRIEALEKK